MSAITASTHARRLTPGTLVAAALAVCVAQVALAIPAVLNGLFQQDLHTSSSQLTWISDAFLVLVTLLELTFGVLGDLFGRKRLLVGGSLLLALGMLIAILTPGPSAPTGGRVLVLWTGQIIAGVGAAALFPTTLAMVAAGTHTARDRARAISIWAAALASGGFISPVLGGFDGRHVLRQRPGRRLTLVVPGRARPCADQCGRVAAVRPELRGPGGPIARLARPDHDRGSRCCSPSSRARPAAGAAVAWSPGSCWPRCSSPCSSPPSIARRHRCCAWNVSLGDFWIAGTSADNLSIAPLVLVGVGFAFSVSAVTAVAVNTVPNHLAGMASGSTSLLRDLGFTLGPAVIGAVALSQAAAEIQSKVASSATFARGAGPFNNSTASVPAAQKPAVEAAIGAVNSGPLGANGVPGTVTLPTGQVVPFNPLKNVAFTALDHAYSLGYVICGVAGLVAALLSVVALGGRAHDALISAESLAQDTVGEVPARVRQPEAVTI